MGHAGTGGPVEELKIPYQIFGESLASASVLTLRGYRVSSQQVSLTASHPSAWATFRCLLYSHICGQVCV